MSFAELRDSFESGSNLTTWMHRGPAPTSRIAISVKGDNQTGADQSGGGRASVRWTYQGRSASNCSTLRAADKCVKRISQIGVRIDVVDPTCHGERVQSGASGLSRLALEQHPVAAVEDEGSGEALDYIGIRVHLAVLQETAQLVPMRKP